MSNYTKGEWTKEGNKIKVSGHGTIAICPSPTNSEGAFEFVANAYLIAAAPDMYEALKYAYEWCWKQTKAPNDIYDELGLKLIHALAKAEE